MKHAYVVTERIPGIEKMPNVRDHDASVYLKLQVGLYSTLQYAHKHNITFHCDVSSQLDLG